MYLSRYIRSMAAAAAAAIVIAGVSGGATAATAATQATSVTDIYDAEALIHQIAPELLHETASLEDAAARIQSDHDAQPLVTMDAPAEVREEVAAETEEEMSVSPALSLEPSYVTEQRGNASGIRASNTHVDGAGSTISFDFNPSWPASNPSYVRAQLVVSAYIMNDDPVGLGQPAYTLAATSTWNTFAARACLLTASARG